MKSQSQAQIEQASKYVFFDPETGTILLAIDKLSLALTLEEFSDLANEISSGYSFMIDALNVIEVVEYDEDGKEKKVLMSVSQDDDIYN